MIRFSTPRSLKRIMKKKDREKFSKKLEERPLVGFSEVLHF
jgi:hypothetical protein